MFFVCAKEKFWVNKNGKKVPYLNQLRIITDGTKIIADPKTCFHELSIQKLVILLRDRPCLGLFPVSSHFQALLFLEDKLLELV